MGGGATHRMMAGPDDVPDRITITPPARACARSGHVSLEITNISRSHRAPLPRRREELCRTYGIPNKVIPALAGVTESFEQHTARTLNPAGLHLLERKESIANDPLVRRERPRDCYALMVDDVASLAIPHTKPSRPAPLHERTTSKKSEAESMR